jgi:uncharacterized protein YodC (DUF2158 family)
VVRDGGARPSVSTSPPHHERFWGNADQVVRGEPVQRTELKECESAREAVQGEGRSRAWFETAVLDFRSRRRLLTTNGFLCSWFDGLSRNGIEEATSARVVQGEGRTVWFETAALDLRSRLRLLTTNGFLCSWFDGLSTNGIEEATSARVVQGEGRTVWFETAALDLRSRRRLLTTNDFLCS